MQGDVHCSHNNRPININIKHVNGRDVDITIDANKALIDSDGLIRFFSLEFSDGDVQGYQLHPHVTETGRVIAWVVDFLAGYGLSRAGSSLVRSMPGMSVRQAEVVHLGRYFTFSNPGGQVIRSFISRHFLPEHLGYHNIITGALIWTSAIRVRSS